MGAEHHVHRAVGQTRDGGLGVGVALESGQRLDHDGELRVSLAEGLEVLLDQQRRRHQHRHLFAVLHRLERCPHGDFSFAVADITADQPIHRDRLLHVRLHLVDAGHLVRGLHEREGIFQLSLPRSVRAEGVPHGGHPGAIQTNQFTGDLPDVPAGAGLGLLPIRAAEAVQRGSLTSDVPGDLVKLVRGHEEAVTGLAPLARGILQHQIFAGCSSDGPLRHLHEPAYAVLFVNHEVTGSQLQRVDLLAAP